MLLPKRTKFRKAHKGRNRGLATTGNRVSFGEFGLQATTRGRMTSRQIEAGRRKAEGRAEMSTGRQNRKGVGGTARPLGRVEITGKT